MSREASLGWALTLPALAAIAVVAVFPIGWTTWESLHAHDLRMPWLGRPFVGLANYAEALSSTRFWSALAHTAVFAALTVTLELTAGFVLALVVDRIARGRDLVRTAVLLPWAIPTVVVALVWRFLFETPSGLVNDLLRRLAISSPTWFADPFAAWVPVMLADAWKMTPFVAVLLLAGLQTIDRSLYEAARMDGAGWRRQFTDITLPLLRPALLVAFIFRTLDALRVFDVIYVMTAGGPGTATEPIALLTFSTLLQNLRFGFGAALSMIVFAFSFVLAVVCIRLLGRQALLERVR
ncbi:MAG TPA: sugar ABC transporter permease [Vicinamibacterales bacterium]|nr:sugar ABC transporter permease [Vicinamibacterales bacterium]